MSFFRPLFGLHGRAALVSGASSGIGLHIAHTLARAGAKVALGARRRERIAQAAATLCEQGYSACGITLDVTCPDAFPEIWRQAESALGQRIDILFNNAGVLYAERFVDQARDQVEKVFDTDLKGAFLLAQQAALRAVAAARWRCVVAGFRGWQLHHWRRSSCGWWAIAFVDVTGASFIPG